MKFFLAIEELYNSDFDKYCDTGAIGLAPFDSGTDNDFYASLLSSGKISSSQISFELTKNYDTNTLL